MKQAIEKAKTALKDHANNAEELQKATDELMQSPIKLLRIFISKKAAIKAQPGQEQEEPKNDQGPIDTDIS